MRNKGNGERERSTGFPEPTYLSGSMKNGFIDTESGLLTQLSNLGSGGRSGVGIDAWAERAKGARALVCGV